MHNAQSATNTAVIVLFRAAVVKASDCYPESAESKKLRSVVPILPNTCHPSVADFAFYAKSAQSKDPYTRHGTRELTFLPFHKGVLSRTLMSVTPVPAYHSPPV